MIPNIDKIIMRGAKLVEIPYLLDYLRCQDNDKVLVVGERSGEEGILLAVQERTNESNQITLVDLDEVAPSSYVEEAIKINQNIHFIYTDFIELHEGIKYDYIVCINVLEHFGMSYGGHNDIINWDKDLIALKKMMRMFKKRIIITVPAGPPIFYGDTLENGLPFLRRYDKQRMHLIYNIIKENKCVVKNEMFLYSKNLDEWQKISNGIDAFSHEFSHYHLPTPNCLWTFCIEHE